MKEEQFILQIGTTIDALRKKKGFTIEALGNLIEMDKSNLNRIIKGRSNPTAKNLYKLAKALGVQPYELLK